MCHSYAKLPARGKWVGTRHRIYDWIVAAENIHDSSVPARDHLVECLRQVLATTGSGPEARSSTAAMVRTSIDVGQTGQVREAYLAIGDDGRRLIEAWLRILTGEGVLPKEGIACRTRFLSTIISGLGLARALPADDDMRAGRDF